MTRRPPFAVVMGLVIVAIVAGTLGVAAFIRGPGPTGAQLVDGRTADPAATPTPIPTPVPIPGHEVFGFVPYWEMDDTIAAHLAKTPLTTLALFSVTNRKNGTLNETQNGYKKITGPIGRQMIREAHDRDVGVQIVYTSFGYTKNAAFFGGPVATQDKVIASLVTFVDDLGLDGVNVDVEQLDGEFVAAYGSFVERLRAALRADHKQAQVSVATTANEGGAAMAAAATTAGVDRIFLMGYDYHWSGSAPGASAPLDRVDGDEKDLVWSLDLYASLGVPVQRTLLGLPLYGMAWPVAGPEPASPTTGNGDAWIPSDHLPVLDDPTITPTLEPIEQVEIYTVPTMAADGTAGWQVVYVDSPDTMTPKLGLADARGLAGAGFWAIGYERGVPGFTALIKRFHAGKLTP